jgi:hypothetical protein
MLEKSSSTGANIGHTARIEGRIVLPIKAALTALLLYSFYSSPWFGMVLSESDVKIQLLQTFLWVYIALNVITGAFLARLISVRPEILRWIALTTCLSDGFFITSLVVLSGQNPPPFWPFLLLMIRNAASMTEVSTRLLLNLFLTICYSLAGLIAAKIAGIEAESAAFTPLNYPLFTAYVAVLFLFALSSSSFHLLFHRRTTSALSG